MGARGRWDAWMQGSGFKQSKGCKGSGFAFRGLVQGAKGEFGSECGLVVRRYGLFEWCRT
jgi:hypothetical protein